MSENHINKRMNYLLVPLAALAIAGFGTFFATGMPPADVTSNASSNMNQAASSTMKAADMTPAQMKMMIKNDEIKGAAVATESGQAVAVKVDTGYSPNVIEVKKGTPLTITFDRNSTFKCSRKVQFPSLGSFMTVMPDHGKVTLIVPIPSQAGQTIEFMCGMKMIKGKLVTVD